MTTIGTGIAIAGVWTAAAIMAYNIPTAIGSILVAAVFATFFIS